MPSFKLSPLANSIKNAFWSWNNPANPNLLNNYTPAERASAGIFPVEMLKAPEPMGSIITAATHNGETMAEIETRILATLSNPEVLEHSDPHTPDCNRCYAEAMDRACEETSAALRDGTLGVVTIDGEEVEALPMPGKPKRVRVRSPKLYQCDIESGGMYVPKRGNDKSPHLVVVEVRNNANGEVERVEWTKTNEGGMPLSSGTAEDFLALVARRVEA